MFWGGALSVSGSVSASVAKPAAPSNLKNTRKAGVPRDGTLTWDAGARASDYGIQTGYDGAALTTKWYSASRSFPVVNWPQDTRVQVRVFSRNSAGNSAYSNTITFYTPAAKPAKPTLERTADGVLVKAVKNKYPYGLEFKRSDGVEGSVGTGTAALSAFQILDSSPGGVDLTYQVRIFAGPESDRVYSAWSDSSAKITTLAPPNAATRLAPAGILGEGAVTFQWRHNPADGTAQSAAQIRYRLVGTTTWTTVTVTGGGTSKALSLPPGSYEWQVATKGLDNTYGDWSSVGAFQVITAPIVTIEQPTDAPWTTSVLSVEWVTGQAEGLPQSAWRARLRDRYGALVEEDSGTGATTRHTFKQSAEDGDQWQVEVLTACSGIWSNPANQIVNAEFYRPPTPLGEVHWDDTIGAHRVTIGPGDAGTPKGMTAYIENGQLWFSQTPPERPTNLAAVGNQVWYDDEVPGDDLAAVFTPGTGELTFVNPRSLTESTASLAIYRSVDGAQTWETVEDAISPQQTGFLDYEGLSYGVTHYRLVARTLLGAEAELVLPAVAESSAVWVGVGAQYATLVPLRILADWDMPEVGVDDTYVYFDGDQDPTLIEGDAMTLTATASAKLLPHWVDADTPDVKARIKTMMRTKGIGLFRTPDGDRIRGKVTVNRLHTNVKTGETQVAVSVRRAQ